MNGPGRSGAFSSAGSSISRSQRCLSVSAVTFMDQDIIAREVGRTVVG